MSGNEKLIEEAAKAIFEVNNRQDMTQWPRSSYQAVYRERARAALAVFEKAHTPTDDEREALAKLLDEIDSEWLMGEARPPYPSEMAHELILRGVGFRRSEVPKPSVEHSAHEFCDNRLGCIPKPQGEPSESVVLAAMNAYDPRHASESIDNYSWEHIEDMTNAVRAALRAAGSVEP